MSETLMTRLRGITPLLLLAAGGLLLLRMSGCYAERDGALKAQIAARETVIAALAKQAHTADTTYVRDTVTLTRTRRVTDSLLITDTVIRADTVRQIVARERLACDAVVETCEHRVAVRDSMLAATGDLLRLERKRRPSFLGTLLTKVTWAAIGYGAGRLTK